MIGFQRRYRLRSAPFLRGGLERPSEEFAASLTGLLLSLSCSRTSRSSIRMVWSIISLSFLSSSNIAVSIRAIIYLLVGAQCVAATRIGPQYLKMQAKSSLGISPEYDYKSLILFRLSSDVLRRFPANIQFACKRVSVCLRTIESDLVFGPLPLQLRFHGARLQDAYRSLPV